MNNKTRGCVICAPIFLYGFLCGVTVNSYDAKFGELISLSKNQIPVSSHLIEDGYLSKSYEIEIDGINFVHEVSSYFPFMLAGQVHHSNYKVGSWFYNPIGERANGSMSLNSLSLGKINAKGLTLSFEVGDEVSVEIDIDSAEQQFTSPSESVKVKGAHFAYAKKGIVSDFSGSIEQVDYQYDLNMKSTWSQLHLGGIKRITDRDQNYSDLIFDFSVTEGITNSDISASVIVEQARLVELLDALSSNNIDVALQKSLNDDSSVIFSSQAPELFDLNVRLWGEGEERIFASTMSATRTFPITLFKINPKLSDVFARLRGSGAINFNSSTNKFEHILIKKLKSSND
ncbi:hypothetical protein [Vibrio harveyi]|uniref:hypothetical protein n=1 Tax=Vibrio harveyi TaxID=669 RepID=UPI003D7124F2